VQAAHQLGVALDAYRVGSDELADADGGFADGYGISAAGAVVVRPDGFIGWPARAPPTARQRRWRVS
jgi:putative polyketide hydroxylase